MRIKCASILVSDRGRRYGGETSHIHLTRTNHDDVTRSTATGGATSVGIDSQARRTIRYNNPFPPFLSVFSDKNDTCGSCTCASCQGGPVWMSRSDGGKHNELLVGLY